MLQILINFVFKILSVVATIVFYPLQALLNAFVPGIGDTLNQIVIYLSYLVSYAPFIFYILAVPDEATAVFFTYILGKYTLYISYVAIKFILKAYQKLKP